MLEKTNTLHYASGVIAPDYYFINSRFVAELLFQYDLLWGCLYLPER